MVHGEFTNDLGARDRDRMGTDMDRDRDADASGTAGDSGDPTIAGRDRAGDTAAGVDNERREGDRSATGQNREQLGVELGKIVINGEEYDIDTEPVPLPGTAGSYSAGKQGSGTESASGSAALSSSMVFTLSENVEIPTNTEKSE
ncbi:MAG: hypothetical protein EHM89_18945 [Acidobacteria bacterium]|nr:MAG: hypothetical protein EHM89_18945 [Acidobacteriota bacterium]